MYIEVVPAYGRDYKNQKDARADWDADKDFRDTQSGSYINKSGAEEEGVKVIIRYANQRKVMSV
jgi:hypothetical protein